MASSPYIDMEALSVVGAPPEERVSFDEVYNDWFPKIERWSYALGCPKAELDDVVQEVFLVVRRKLEQFDGNNLAGWLYRITARKVKDYRRRAWFKGLFFCCEVEPVAVAESPEEDYERRQRLAALRRVLDEMSEKRRSAFILYELEGYSGQEVADLLEIPIKTVWTRLHHARREFSRIVAAERRRGSLT